MDLLSEMCGRRSCARDPGASRPAGTSVDLIQFEARTHPAVRDSNVPPALLSLVPPEGRDGLALAVGCGENITLCVVTNPRLPLLPNVEGSIS